MSQSAYNALMAERAQRTLNEPLNIGTSSRITRPPNGSRGPASAGLIFPTTCIAQLGTLNLALSSSQIVYDVAAPTSEFATNLVADIEFGLGGAPTTIRADVRGGAQISLHANTLKVTAHLLPSSPDGIWNSNDPLAISVAASVSGGTRAARSYNTLTYPATTLEATPDPLSAANFEIPNYAYALQIYADQSSFFSPGGVAVQLLGTDQQVGYAGGLVVQEVGGGALLNAQQGEGIKLPPNARSLALINLTPVVYSATVMFALAV